MGMREWVRDQPFLAGCVGCLITSAIVCGGFAALGAIGGFQIVSCATAGLDDATDTYQDAMDAGFMMGMQINNGERTFHLEPISQREVTCADLEAIIFPHLTGELESVTLTSTSYVGSSMVPITCEYSGYPTAP